MNSYMKLSPEYMKEEGSGISDDVTFPELMEEKSDESIHSYRVEAIAQFRLAFPVICTFVMRKSVDIVSVIFVGRLGPSWLSAAGIAAVSANVTGNSMVDGLAGALSTLCSQAYGSKDMQSFNLMPQKAALILSIMICVPVSVLWLYSSPVMVALGQSQQLGELALKYLIVLIPSQWTLSFSICIQNWLYVQSKTRAIAIITFIVALIHPFWCYFYIYMIDLGYLGAALAVTTSKISEFIMLIIYIYFGSVLKENNFEFSWDAYHDWGPFLYLGLPNLFMMGQWWASEAITFMAGALAYPEHQVSAMIIYQNTTSICFMISSAFHVAASIRVGNNIGAGLPNLAKMAAYTSPSLAFAGILITSFTLYTCRGYWAFLFTTNEILAGIVISMMPILAIYVILDGVLTSLTGVLKGLGKQRIGGPVVLFSYYCIGLPLSYNLAFPLNMGVIGLCIGTTVGTLVHVFLYFYIIMSTNWIKETEKLQGKKRASFIKQYPTIEYSGDSDDDEEKSKWIFDKICVQCSIFKIFQIFSSQKYTGRMTTKRTGKYENLKDDVDGFKGEVLIILAIFMFCIMPI